jgi:hypothetical protein
VIKAGIGFVALAAVGSTLRQIDAAYFPERPAIARMLQSKAMRSGKSGVPLFPHSAINVVAIDALAFHAGQSGGNGLRDDHELGRISIPLAMHGKPSPSAGMRSGRHLLSILGSPLRAACFPVPMCPNSTGPTFMKWLTRDALSLHRSGRARRRLRIRYRRR